MHIEVDLEEYYSTEEDDENTPPHQEVPLPAVPLAAPRPPASPLENDFILPKRPHLMPSMNNGACSSTHNTSVSLEEADNCTICLSPFTNSGDHRISCLSCGHLFGYGCILKWFSSQQGAASCPQCNSKAKRHDVRIIYAQRLVALDTAERDRALESLEKERSLRKTAEIDSAEYRMRFRNVNEEFTRLKAQYQELNEKYKQLSLFGGRGELGSDRNTTQSAASASTKGFYKDFKQISSLEVLECRHLVYCDYLNSLFSTQESTSALAKGFGIRSIRLEPSLLKLLPIHGKHITGLSLHSGLADGIVLSSSLDSTVKLTSITTEQVVLSYQCNSQVRSCVWAPDTRYHFYAGFNGFVHLYDTRRTSHHVEEIRLSSNLPVVSLQYMPTASGGSAAFPQGGLLIGQSNRLTFMEADLSRVSAVPQSEVAPEAGLEYQVHPLDAGSNLVWLAVEPKTRHVLTTHRAVLPDRPKVHHRLYQLSNAYVEQSEPVNANGHTKKTVCAHLAQEFQAGAPMSKITQATVFHHPTRHDDLLVAAGDEASNSVYVWDVSSGSSLTLSPANVQPQAPITSVTTFNRNRGLAVLSGKALTLYNWVNK